MEIEGDLTGVLVLNILSIAENSNFLDMLMISQFNSNLVIVNA